MTTITIPRHLHDDFLKHGPDAADPFWAQMFPLPPMQAGEEIEFVLEGASIESMKRVRAKVINTGTSGSSPDRWGGDYRNAHPGHGWHYVVYEADWSPVEYEAYPTDPDLHRKHMATLDAEDFYQQRMATWEGLSPLRKSLVAKPRRKNHGQ